MEKLILIPRSQSKLNLSYLGSKLNWLTPQVETLRLKSDVEVGTKIFSKTNTWNRNPSKTHKSKYDFTYHLYQSKYTYFVFMYYKYLYLSPLFECPQRAITSDACHLINKGKHLVYKKVFALEI